MSPVQEMMEWAFDLVQKHPITEYTGQSRAWKLAIQLAQLRVELEIAMQESLVKIGAD